MFKPISELFAEASYRQYVQARDSSPLITPNSWRHVFGNAVFEFEARYQTDKAIQKAKSWTA